MVLVNGSKGIGTGFSTDIMCYNPLQIMQKITLMLENKPHEMDIHPYYHGFKGSIELFNDNKNTKKYLIRGVYKKLTDNKILITELPVGIWTQDYKEYIESLLDSKKKDYKPLIKDFTETCTESSIDFVIEFYSGVLNKLTSGVTDISGNSIEQVSALEKLLKLYTTHSITNMHLFDDKEHLRKFTSPS